MGMFKNKEKRPVTKGKGKGRTPKQKRFVDSMDSMKHLSPEMQERMRELEDGGMEKEELEETARKFLAHPIGKKDDSGETAEELARLAQADLERQRLEEEAAAAEAKKQREIAEAKAAAEAAAAARIAAAAREKARDDVIVAIFNRLDTDASGGVSIAELVKAMRRDNTLAFTLGLADRHLSQTDGTMDKIAALFYEFDDDQGGQLSVNEFAKLIKSAPELVVPHSMQAEARAARFEGQIADVFDVRAFAKGIMKRVVKNAHRDARRSGAADSDASSDSDASDASDSETSSESSSSASPPLSRAAALEDAEATGSRAARGEKDAIESIFAFLDKDDSGTVTVREMIIGVRKEPALARTLGLGEGRVDQEALVEMFSKWDENGDRELDRAEFAAIFGPSIADAERAEARRRADERAVIIAKAVEEKAFAEAEAARLAEEEAAKAAERAEIARLREELDAMKAKLDTTMSSRSLSARKRLGRRGGSPAAEKRSGTGAFEAGYVSGGSGPGASARPGAAAAKPAWHSPSYTSYLDSPEFKRLGMAEALEAAKSPRAVNGYWREPLNMTALRPHSRKQKAADVVAEAVPVARYKEQWRDGLRNGDIRKFADRKPRPAGAPSPAGFEPAWYANAQSPVAEALDDARGGAARMFSRGFQRHYLGGSGRAATKPGYPNFLADPPGVKTSASEVVGVAGLTRSHKRDLRHKGHVQPVSFHRNVVGDAATTHTSTAPGEMTQYPKSERTKHERVWI